MDPLLTIEEYNIKHSSRNVVFAYITAVERNDVKMVEWILSDTDRAKTVLVMNEYPVAKTENLQILDLIFDANERINSVGFNEKGEGETYPFLFIRSFLDHDANRPDLFQHFIEHFKKNVFDTMLYFNNNYYAFKCEEDKKTMMEYFRQLPKLPLMQAVRYKFYDVALVLVEMGAELTLDMFNEIYLDSPIEWAPRFTSLMNKSK